MDNNAQWVKPIMPGDVPEGMRPVWNAEAEKWDMVIYEDHPINLAKKQQEMMNQALGLAASLDASNMERPPLMQELQPK